jgi:hypothetical protein
LTDKTITLSKFKFKYEEEIYNDNKMKHKHILPNQNTLFPPPATRLSSVPDVSCSTSSGCSWAVYLDHGDNCFIYILLVIFNVESRIQNLESRIWNKYNFVPWNRIGCTINTWGERVRLITSCKFTVVSKYGGGFKL